MPKVTAAKSKSRKIAKKPAKKVVVKKVVKSRTKAIKAVTNPLQAEESILESILDNGESFCGDEDGPLGSFGAEAVAEHDPSTITTEETIIGDEPGGAIREILAGLTATTTKTRVATSSFAAFALAKYYS